MTKVSIIIPVYNVEPYIEECLLSVSSQTMTEGVECIIVDDCGKDNSMSIAERFIEEYVGKISFSIIHHGSNRGLSAARNTGIKAAKGEYVYFLDSDDTITADCIQRMYAFIERYGKVDLVQGSFYENDEEKRTQNYILKQEHLTDKKTIKRFLLTFHGYIVAAQSRLIKKDKIISNGLFFREGIIHEDNYWTFFLAKHIDTMCFCSERTYYHRYNPESITGKINKEKESKAYSTILKELSGNIDSFMKGEQKEYILYNYITAIDNGYYHDEEERRTITSIITGMNSRIENLLFSVYSKTSYKATKDKLLHLLIRLYKL